MSNVASPARAWLKEHKTLPKKEAIQRCCKATGLHSDTVRRMWNEECGSTTITQSKSSYRTIKDFRGMHDIQYKITKAIESLPDDGYVTELEFREMVGIDSSRFSKYRDRFESNFVSVRERGRDIIYWAKPKMIKKMMEVMG